MFLLKFVASLNPARSKNWKVYFRRQENLTASPCSTVPAICPRNSSWRVTTNTPCTTWGGRLFIWRLPLPAGAAQVQGGLVVVETLFLYETELTGRPALRSVVRLIIKTVMQRCPFMVKQEKPLRLVKRLGLSTTIAVVTRLTEGVKYQPPLLISITFLKVTPTTAFAVADSRIKR